MVFLDSIRMFELIRSQRLSNPTLAPSRPRVLLSPEAPERYQVATACNIACFFTWYYRLASATGGTVFHDQKFVQVRSRRAIEDDKVNEVNARHFGWAPGRGA